MYVSVVRRCSCIRKLMPALHYDQFGLGNTSGQGEVTKGGGEVEVEDTF